MHSKVKFKISRCYNFARLSNSIGKGCLVWSKEHAFKIIRQFVSLNTLTKEQEKMLRSKVASSNLPSETSMVDPKVVSIINNTNLSYMLHFFLFEIELDEKVLEARVIDEIDLLIAERNKAT